MAQLLHALRTGEWLTRERVRLVAIALLAASLLGIVFLAATSDGLNDRLGRPLGTDFANVYAAGTYVLDGQPAAAFDPARQFAREQAIFGAATQFYGWHYPPFFLGLAALLALMPYALALVVWQGTTLGLYLWAIGGIFSASCRALGRASTSSLRSGKDVDGRDKPGHDGLWLILLLALAFPAVFINLGHGHNGFLTAALMTGALLQLDRRPVIAGVLFGLLAYKPQFGLLVPFVLAASGRWRAFAAAAATVGLLAFAVTATFGVDVWRAFLDSSSFTREVVLERGDTGWYKIQSAFSWARMWGAPVGLAYVVQATATLCVGGAVMWLWRTAAPFALKAAALLIATLLATPYSLDYDLMLLAPAIGFLAVDGIKSGYAPYQKTLLAALWLMPLAARSLAEATLMPLAVPLMLVVFTQILMSALARTAQAKPLSRPAH
jgi:alpha-1,2-mannosyltransferase